MSFKISGTGSCVPEKVFTNDDLSRMMDTSDAWIRSKTGIERRHILSTESLSDLAERAAIRALESAKINAQQLDLIICATIQGDFITPSLACVVQSRIGASCPAFDINAACSGFVYALDTAAGFIERGRAKNVLIVCAEAMSRHVDFDDRATCVLFGDGAGAVVLTPGEGLLSIKTTAAGNSQLMRITCGKSGRFEEAQASPSVLIMNGQEVYRFAVSAMKADIEDVISAAGLSTGQVTYILPHQANMRIIRAATALLGIGEDKILCNIENFGNMSSASIPVLLDESHRQGLLKNGDIIVLSSFGGGLTTGACAIRWNKN